MTSMIDLIYISIAYFIMLSGLFFCITAAIGLIRMPDIFTKMHACSVSDSCGIALILLSLMMIHGLTIVSCKILLIIFAIYIYAPAISLEIGSYATKLSNEEGDNV